MSDHMDELFKEMVESEPEIDQEQLKKKFEFIQKARPLFKELSHEELINFFISGIITTGHFCEQPRTFFLKVAQVFLEISKEYKEEKD